MPVPQLGPKEVLVKIMKIGVCGLDIHVYYGKHPFTKYPVTQGHEVSGKIVELGSEVTGLAVGQKVTIEPQVYCGRCPPCTHGKYNLCEELRVMGFQTTDTAGEYFAVDAGKVTRLPAVRVRRLVLWGQSKYIKGVMRRSRRTGAPDVESAKRLALQTAFSLKAGGTYEAEEALV